MITKLRGFTLLTMLLALLIYTGCSKDEDNVPQTGDPDSAEFQETRAQIDASVQYSVAQLTAGMAFVGGVGPTGLAKPSAPADTTIGWEYSEGWWWYYAEYTYQGYQTVTSDSIQYRTGGSPVQEWSANVDEMEFRLMISVEQATTDVDFYFAMIYSGLNTDTYTLNGSGSYDVNLTVEGYSGYYRYETTYTNITFAADGSDDWPQSGTAEVTLVENVSSGGQSDVSWSITITFYSDHYHVRAESGGVVYEYDYYYSA